MCRSRITYSLVLLVVSILSTEVYCQHIPPTPTHTNNNNGGGGGGQPHTSSPPPETSSPPPTSVPTHTNHVAPTSNPTPPHGHQTPSPPQTTLPPLTTSCFTNPPSTSLTTITINQDTFRLWPLYDAWRCFNAELFNAAKAQIILDEARNVLMLYSYTDKIKQQMQIDAMAVLDSITTERTYTTMYGFYIDIMNLFNSFQDPHTLFTLPSEYMGFQTFRPFLLNVVPTSDSNPTRLLNTYRNVVPPQKGWGSLYDMNALKPLLTLQTSVNNIITKVDGINATEWMKSEAALVSGYRNQSAQINAAVELSFARRLHIIPLQNYSETTSETFTLLSPNHGNNKQQTFTVPIYVIQKITGRVAGHDSHYYFPSSKTQQGSRSKYDRAEGPKPRGFHTLNVQYGTMPDYVHKSYFPATPPYMMECGVYAKDVAVLTLYSFALPPVYETNETHGLLSVGNYLLQCVKNFVWNSHINNLLIDVRGNAGGLLRISSLLLSILLEDHRPMADMVSKVITNTTPSDFDAWGIFDFRVSTHTAGSSYLTTWLHEYLDNKCANPVSGEFYPITTWWVGGNPGHPSEYPSQASYSPFFRRISDPVYHNVSQLPDYGFHRIAVLTDGLCGSACAQFVSKLMTANVARVYAVGGLPGEAPHVPFSYPGGTVISHDDFVKNRGFQPLPNEIKMTFNFLEFYPDNNQYTAVPLEFQNVTAPYYINEWYPYDEVWIFDTIFEDLTSTAHWPEQTGWARMPPLPPTPPDMTPIIMGSTCGAAFFLIVCLLMYLYWITKPKSLSKSEREVLMVPIQ